MSADERWNKSIKHGDAADSSSENEKSEQDCIVREEQSDNNDIYQIENKDSSQSKENSHDISQHNSIIDIEGTNESVEGQGEHEWQGELIETQMQSRTCKSSMMEGA